MYIVSLTLTQPAEQVEPHNKTHGEWVRRYIEEGLILFGSVKTADRGGVILVKSVPQEELDRALAEDSYVMAGVGTYEITPIAVKLTQPWLNDLKTA
ncbi:MAG: cyclohydrolase [Pseudomonas sp.]|nr:cyclohydrolase [Pseudomonas sp.]